MDRTCSRIVGTGSYVAPGVLTNDDLERLVDTSNDWIIERTGIRERRVAPKGVNTSDMAAHALGQAIEMAGLQPNDLDMIICGTVTGDRPLPATATFVQHKLGITNNCPAFDVSAACAGFIYGMTMADALIRNGQMKRVGIIGAELLTRVLDFTDRNSCVLFGDGAGAAVLVAEPAGGRGVVSTHIFSDGSLADIITIPGGGSAMPPTETMLAERMNYVHLEGREVFRHAVRNLVAACEKALEANQLKAADIDLVVAHQANMRIISAVADRIGVPLERFVLNLERFGNTSSASIPIALDEAVRAGRVQAGQRLLMVALGGGLSWGSAIVEW